MLVVCGTTQRNLWKLVNTVVRVLKAHKAAVVGDTVGDPFKDTAGPSLNTFDYCDVMAASFFAPVIATLSLMK